MRLFKPNLAVLVFSIMLLATVNGALVFQQTMDTLVESRDHAVRVYETVTELEALGGALRQLQGAERDYILGGERYQLVRYRDAEAVAGHHLNRLRERARDAVDREDLEQFVALASLALTQSVDLVETRRAAGRKTAAAVLERSISFHSTDATLRRIGEMQDKRRQLLEQYKVRGDKASDFNTAATTATSFLVLLVLGLSAISVHRENAARAAAEQALHRSHDDLELKVAERTSELSGANEELRQSQDKFRNLVELSSDCFWEQDGNGEFQSCSWGRVMGGEVACGMDDPNDPCAMRCIGLNSGDWTALQPFIDSRRPFRDVEIRQARKDDQVRWLSLSGAPFFDSEGRFLGFQGVARDVTLRKQSEELQKRLTAVTEATTDLVAFSDFYGRGLFINPAGRRMLGISDGESVSDFFVSDFWPASEVEKMKNVVVASAMREGLWSGETAFQDRSGRVFPISLVLIAHKRADGWLEYFSAIARDMSERERAEEALRRGEQRFRATFDLAGVGIGHVGTDGRWLRVNQKLCDILEYSRDELLKMSFQDVTYHSDLEADVELAQQALIGEISAYSGEKRYFRKDHSITWISLTVSLVRDANGEPLYFISVIEDINARKQMEQELQEANLRLQALSTRLLEVQEAERRSIARELHDEIGQALTAVKIGLHAIERQAETAPLAEQVKETVRVTDDIMQKVRSLSLQLHPPLLDDLGLVAALRWTLDKQTSPVGIHAHFTADPLPERLPSAVETACFRVVQEALTNVLRHARAREVWLELRHRDEALFVGLKDDGVGFDVEAARARAVQGGSLGVVGMEERVTQAGGNLEIVSVPGEGTEVRVNFPMPRTMRHRRWMRAGEAA